MKDNKKMELLENMVSCYDNGEAMFEYAEEYFEELFQKRIDNVIEVRDIQNENITDGYMQGMYNGIELALCILESREPKYIKADRWNCDKEETTDV